LLTHKLFTPRTVTLINDIADAIATIVALSR